MAALILRNYIKSLYIVNLFAFRKTVMPYAFLDVQFVWYNYLYL